MGILFSFVALNTALLGTRLVSHPMDPLTSDEYVAIITILKAEELVDDSSRYSLISLQEPDKASVLRWKPGSTPCRGLRLPSLKKALTPSR